MLNSVRYGGFGVRELSVVWLQPLAAPTIIVACGPRRISAAMSTTYDTDMFEPLAIGNCTLNAEVSDESRTRKQERKRCGENARVAAAQQNVSAPQRDDAMMYHRPRGGRSRSKTLQVYWRHSQSF